MLAESDDALNALLRVRLVVERSNHRRTCSCPFRNVPVVRIRAEIEPERDASLPKAFRIARAAFRITAKPCLNKEFFHSFAVILRKERIVRFRVWSFTLHRLERTDSSVEAVGVFAFTATGMFPENAHVYGFGMWA